MPSGDPAVDYLSDTFRLTQGPDGLWTIRLVCDATGCYVALYHGPVIANAVRSANPVR